jgi:Hg(II)-responsive transcriptional regulator
MRMTIGEFASKAGVNVQTVRYYERRGILREPERTASGYRQYDGEALARVRFIRRVPEPGFSLEEIEELLDLRVEASSSCSAIGAKTRARLEDVQGKTRELKRAEHVLEKLAASCAAREPTADCPILETLEEATREYPDKRVH